MLGDDSHFGGEEEAGSEERGSGIGGLSSEEDDLGSDLETLRSDRSDLGSATADRKSDTDDLFTTETSMSDIESDAEDLDSGSGGLFTDDDHAFFFEDVRTFADGTSLESMLSSDRDVRTFAAFKLSLDEEHFALSLQRLSLSN